VLKEGGELYFSDVYSDKEISEAARKDYVLWGECISGALLWTDLYDLCEEFGLSAPLLGLKIFFYHFFNFISSRLSSVCRRERTRRKTWFNSICQCYLSNFQAIFETFQRKSESDVQRRNSRSRHFSTRSELSTQEKRAKSSSRWDVCRFEGFKVSALPQKEVLIL